MAMTIQDHIKGIKDEIELCQRQHNMLLAENVKLDTLKTSTNNTVAIEEEMAHNVVQYKRYINRLTQLARTLEFWQNVERTFDSQFSVEDLMSL